MTATEARVHFGELLDTVKRGERVVVEKRGRPVAVFVHPAEYVYLMERRYGRAALTDRLSPKLHRFIGAGWPLESITAKEGEPMTQPVEAVSAEGSAS